MESAGQIPLIPRRIRRASSRNPVAGVWINGVSRGLRAELCCLQEGHAFLADATSTGRHIRSLKAPYGSNNGRL
jgi:hypothetical protein